MVRPAAITSPGTGLDSSIRSSPHRLYRLDGVRALAVLLVFAAHAILPWHGWEGVHLFFVLSGFLITGILRRARNDVDFWKSFYIKRATRILPPLLIFFALAVLLYAPPLKILALYAFFAANFVEVTRHRLPSGVSVLWSLSVEEHFYLFWPFAIRFLTRRQLLVLCTAVLCAEPLLRLMATPFFPNFGFIYMLTPFQLDGLIAGSLLSLLCEEASSREILARWSSLSSALLLALYLTLCITWAQFGLRPNSAAFNSVGYSLVALTSAALLAEVYLHPQHLLSRVLASWPVVFLGTISYGFYLFHYMLLDAAKRVVILIFGVPRGHLTLTLSFLAALLLSWLSFRLYERPIILWGRAQAEQAGARKSPPIPAV